MKQKALRAGDAHSHEDEECCRRSRLRSAVGRSDMYKVREEIFYGQYAEKNHKDCP